MPRVSRAKSKSKSKSRNRYSRNQSARRLVGHGDYSYSKPGPWGRFGRKAGAILAQGFGVPAGIGAHIGGLAHYVGRIFGSGDYKISEPPLTNSLFTGSRQSLSTQGVTFGEKSVRFKHREFLKDVISSSSVGAFHLQTFDINPGLAPTFPFLSALAQNFQTYKMHGLVYEFRSMSADALNSTNTALGSVIACIDYNAASGAFVGKQDMLNSLGAIDCKPSENFLMGVECDSSKIPLNELYIRTANVPYGQDVKTYDMGQLNIASTGMQAASVNLGELHVIYDIELMLPILNPLGTTDQTCIIDYTVGTIGTAEVFPEYSASVPVLNTSVNASVDSISMEVGNIGTGSYVAFPPACAGGIYEIIGQWTGDSTALVSGPSVAVSSGLVLLGDLESPAGAETTTRLMTKYVVSVPNMNDGITNWRFGLFTLPHQGNQWPSLKFVDSTGVFPANLTSVSLSIRRINPAVMSSTLMTTYANNW